VPYARYGESVDSVCAEIEAGCRALKTADPRKQVLALRAGAARNAIDCALWDLEAKRANRPAWELAGRRGPPGTIHTMRTVSVDSVENMKVAAEQLADARVIKVKVDGGADLDRIAAVHEAAPGVELVIDANEAWSAEQLVAWLPALPNLGVAVVEQPLPADGDAALEGLERSVPICADESFHDRRSFANIERRYDMVNIKLDKTGGLTEALLLKAQAEAMGLRVMVGCMLASSLAMAPAVLVAQGADIVDLDGPLLLAADRDHPLKYDAEGVHPPTPELWG